MVEVFKTNVTDPGQAKFLRDRITEQFHQFEVSFDLEDCDRILRIKTSGNPIFPELIIDLLGEHGFRAQVLPENYPLPILQSLLGEEPMNNCW